MINTRILNHPVIAQTEGFLFGTHENGWQVPLNSSDSLPRFPSLEDKLPESVWNESTVTLLLPEIACFPIKVDIAEKVRERELETYLKWHLKKRLPFPSEDAVIQYLPLGNSGQWLVFSLPGAWVQETFEFFESKKVHLGYIGSLAGLFLERYLSKSGSVLLAYTHYYVYLEKNGKKTSYFKVRRFPETGDRILFNEFFPDDFSTRPWEPLKIINLSPSRREEWHALMQTRPGSGISLKEFPEAHGNLAKAIKILGEKS